MNCEKCGSEMEIQLKGSCLGVVCPNCGWGIASTYIDPLRADWTDYTIRLNADGKASVDAIKAVSKLSGCNYLKAKDVIENTGGAILSGKATEIADAKNLLDSLGLNYETTPPFPY